MRAKRTRLREQRGSGARQISEALSGCDILLPVDRRSSELAGALQRHGALTTVAPALTIIPHYDDRELLETTRSIIEDPPDIVIATTGVGFRGWMDVAETDGLGEDLLDAISMAQIVVRGPKARGAVQQAGLDVDWVAESETSRELVEFLITEGVAGCNIVIQHHGDGDTRMEKMLTDAGAQIRGLTIYRNGPPADPDLVGRTTGMVAAGDFDAVLFTSAPGAKSWLRHAEELGTLPQIVEAAADRTVFAAVGPVTADPLKLCGIEPITPERFRLGALVRIVVSHLAGEETGTATQFGLMHVRTGGVLLDGAFYELGRTATDLLRLLAEDAGVVLSRGDLAERGGLTERAVEVTIARIREALGIPEIIETVYKRGYRLAAEERPLTAVG